MEERENPEEKTIENEDDNGGSLRYRLPFALCKERGIQLPYWATPKDAWKALEGFNINPKAEYERLSKKKNKDAAGQKETDHADSTPDISSKVMHDPFDSNAVAQQIRELSHDESSYTEPFENPYRGSVSKVTAGQVYKASKNGNISVLPETIKTLYDASNDFSPMAVKRSLYNQDHLYYDRLETVTRALLNGDYPRAQTLINAIENDAIRRSGKKSVYSKYRDKLIDED